MSSDGLKYNLYKLQVKEYNITEEISADHRTKGPNRSSRDIYDTSSARCKNAIKHVRIFYMDAIAILITISCK